MSIFTRKKILEFLEKKSFTQQWEEIERGIGNEYQSVPELFEAIQSQELCSKKNNTELLLQIKSLQEELEKTTKMGSILSSRLDEKDILLKDCSTLLENERLESKQLKDSIESTNKILLTFIELLERLEYDKHLSINDVRNSILVSIKTILKNNDIEIIDEIGVPFDSKYHNAVSVTPTDNPDLDDHVAESIRSGIIKNGECIKAQDVVLYKTNDL